MPFYVVQLTRTLSEKVPVKQGYFLFGLLLMPNSLMKSGNSEVSTG